MSCLYVSSAGDLGTRRRPSRRRFDFRLLSLEREYASKIFFLLLDLLTYFFRVVGAFIHGFGRFANAEVDSRGFFNRAGYRPREDFYFPRARLIYLDAAGGISAIKTNAAAKNPERRIIQCWMAGWNSLSCLLHHLHLLIESCHACYRMNLEV